MYACNNSQQNRGYEFEIQRIVVHRRIWREKKKGNTIIIPKFGK